MQKFPTIKHSQQFIPEPPAEAGSPPIVMVRTIEQTLKDQAWDRDERERKEWRKIEAFKATLGTGEGEQYSKIVDDIMRDGFEPVLLDTNKYAAEVISKQREQARVDKAMRVVTPLTIVEDGHPLPFSPAVSVPSDLLAKNTGDDAERAKYEKMWGFDQYRAVAPGEGIAARFMEIAKPKTGSEVIDFGAGTGRGALMLAIMGMKVNMLDFATNCLDEDVRNALTTQAHVLSFHQQDLRQAVPYVAEYGYCTDVMEHIEPDHVPAVLSNILRSAQHVFFQISCTDDVCGALIGEPLHLSVHPYAWWHDLFTKLGCAFHWSKDEGDTCLFYVSGWIQGKDMVDAGVLNSTMEQVRRNVEYNLGPQYIDDPDTDYPSLDTHNDASEPTFRWKQVTPHETNDTEMMILGSGPSLARSLETIQSLRAAGVKVITLNGAYQWCRQNGILPVNQIVVDARPFNSRFTHPVEPGCNYFIASQCDPSVLEGLPRDRTWLWHTTAESIKDILDKQDEVSWGIPGGSTVLLRAIPMLRMLGFTKFHLFGCDSCCDDDGTHHTTLQPENNNTPFPVLVNGRQFLCHPDQFSQAQEFMDLIKVMGSVIELEIYGDGLLQWILQSGAQQADLLDTPTSDDQFVL